MFENGFHNADCMKHMREYPDNYFDLAIVDPPYGDGGGNFKSTDKSRFGSWFDKYKMEQMGGGFDKYKQVSRTGGTWASKHGKKIIAWDVAPEQEYFDELFRISRRQIIWGGNYFNLPPTRCFIIWRKTNIPTDFSMAMCEYAWTSFNDNAKVFDYSNQNQTGRFHPSQKPVELYKWLLKNYAKEGDLILDTHVGSASSLIACEQMGFNYVGFEIDEEYYRLAKQRLDTVKAQVNIFDFIPRTEPRTEPIETMITEELKE